MTIIYDTLKLNFEGSNNATTWTDTAQELSPTISTNCSITTSTYQTGSSSLKLTSSSISSPSRLVYTIPNIVANFTIEQYVSFQAWSSESTSQYSMIRLSGPMAYIQIKQLYYSSAQRFLITIVDRFGNVLLNSYITNTLGLNSWYKLSTIVIDGIVQIKINDSIVAQTSSYYYGSDLFSGMTTYELYNNHNSGQDLWVDNLTIINNYKYWVNNSGSWTDISHWSLTSGGAGGANIPKQYDIAIFDENSISLPDQTITMNQYVNIPSLDFTGVLNNPTVLVTATYLYLYGYLKLKNGMTFTCSDVRTIHILSNSTIQLFGVILDLFYFYIHDGATLNILSDANINGVYSYGGGGEGILSLNSSKVTISCGSLDVTGLNLQAGTSEIIINMDSADGATIIGNSDHIFYDVSFKNPNEYSGLVFINAYNFHNLSFYDAPYTIKFNHYYPIRCSDFRAIGSPTKLFIMEDLYQSEEDGYTWSLIVPSGSVDIMYCSLQGSTASGGATFNALIGCEDEGNNYGWNFSPPQDKYWINNSGSILDPEHWSLTSGGPSVAILPSRKDRAIFDENSFTIPNQEIIIPEEVEKIGGLNFSNVLNSPKILIEPTHLIIYGDIILKSGMTVDVGHEVFPVLRFYNNCVLDPNGVLLNNISLNVHSIGDSLSIISDTSVSSITSFTSLFLNDINLTLTGTDNEPPWIWIYPESIFDAGTSTIFFDMSNGLGAYINTLEEEYEYYEEHGSFGIMGFLYGEFGSTIVFNNVTFKNARGGNSTTILSSSFEGENGSQLIDDGTNFLPLSEQRNTIIDTSQFYSGNSSLKLYSVNSEEEQEAGMYGGGVVYEKNIIAEMLNFDFTCYFKFSEIPLNSAFMMSFGYVLGLTILNAGPEYVEELGFSGMMILIQTDQSSVVVPSSLTENSWHKLNIRLSLENHIIYFSIDDTIIHQILIPGPGIIQTSYFVQIMSYSEHYYPNFKIWIDSIEIKVLLPVEKVHILGSNTFNILKFLDPSYEVWFLSGTSQVIKEDFICDGEPEKLMYLKSSSALEFLGFF